MHVVEDEDDGPLDGRVQSTQLRDDLQDLDQRRSGEAAELLLADIAYERTQDLYPGPVRWGAFCLGGPPGEDSRAAPERFDRQGFSQACLPNPGFTAQQEHSACAFESAVQAGKQQLELCLAADEHRRGQVSCPELSHPRTLFWAHGRCAKARRHGSLMPVGR